MAEENVQDQHTSEELSEEQLESEFDKRLHGNEVESGDTESPDAEPEGEAEGDQVPEAEAEKPEEQPDDLRKERDALKKEIARLREGKREGSDRVERLEQELEALRSKINQGSDRKNPIEEWDFETTNQQLALWEDKVDEFRETGETEKLEQAKQYVRVIRKALPEKLLKTGETKNEAKTKEQAIKDGTLSMTDLALEKFPDIENQESDLVGMLNEEMKGDTFQTLNEAVGPTLASHFALYRAILKNPDILKSRSKPEKVLKDVNKQLTKASMNAGAKNSSQPSSLNIDRMSDKELDKLFDDLETGRRTSI